MSKPRELIATSKLENLLFVSRIKKRKIKKKKGKKTRSWQSVTVQGDRDEAVRRRASGSLVRPSFLSTLSSPTPAFSVPQGLSLVEWIACVHGKALLVMVAHAVTTTREHRRKRQPRRRWRAALLTIINMIAIIRTCAGVRPNSQPTTTVDDSPMLFAFASSCLTIDEFLRRVDFVYG